MNSEHLDPRFFRSLLRRQLSEEETVIGLWHLAECQHCRDAFAQISGRGQRIAALLDTSTVRPSRSESYTKVFQNLRRKLETEATLEIRRKEQLPSLAAELLSVPPELACTQITEETRFHSFALARYLLDCCRAKWVVAPTESERHAQLAITIIETKRAQAESSAVFNDLLAQAWAYLGNSRRVLTDFRTADADLAAAMDLLDGGTADPLLRGELLDLQASLRREQRRFPEALSLLDRAAANYKKANDKHLVGRTLLKKTLTLNEAGEPEKGLELLERAEALLQKDREPYLGHVVVNQTVHTLLIAGRHEEGLQLIPTLRGTAADLGTEIDEIRTEFLEAQLLMHLGRYSRAERLLLKVCRRFAETDNGYEAALASLILASLYLRDGETGKTRQLAMEMLPIFESHEIRRESLAALLIFKKAAELETVTVGMVEDIAQYLRRSHKNPALRYEPPS